VIRQSLYVGADLRTSMHHIIYTRHSSWVRVKEELHVYAWWLVGLVVGVDDGLGDAAAGAGVVAVVLCPLADGLGFFPRPTGTRGRVLLSALARTTTGVRFAGFLYILAES